MISRLIYTNKDIDLNIYKVNDEEADLFLGLTLGDTDFDKNTNK